MFRTNPKVCCVEGCVDVSSSRHRFPVKREEVLEIWFQRVGNNNLRLLERKKLYNTFICSSHFIKDCINGKYLIRYSLPTINMPGFSEVPSRRNSFFYALQSAACDETADVSYSLDSPDDIMKISDNVEQSCPTTTSENVQSSILKSHCKQRGKGVLAKINVTRQSHLTTRERKLYQVATKCIRKNHQLAKEAVKAKQRLRDAQKFSQTAIYREIGDRVSPIVYEFLMCQIKQYNLKPRGRRFTNQDKIVALSLYKASPRGYRLLQKLFALPSRRTLYVLLKDVPFSPGINNHICEHLRKITQSLPMKDKYCTMIFDEIALQPGLYYSKSRDFIEGFVDFGKERQLRLADHALVFLVQGIYRNWKQPLFFTFCESATPTSQLVILIKEAIQMLISVGLTPVATVCDQGTNNQAAINTLINETRNTYRNQNVEYRGVGFEVDHQEIIPLFDYPHLLKCIRNNLLTKDLCFMKNGVERRASWKYIIKLYEMDSSRLGTRVCPKLTDCHVYPEKLRKMKVSVCTQVLSRTVGALMGFLAENKIEPFEEAEPTAEVIQFFDTLFDSFNGVNKTSSSQNELRCVVTPNSKHLDFWKEAKNLLRSMSFECLRTKKRTHPPTIKNWIHTINGMEQLWQSLQKKGFTYMIPKNFNQDAVENFFSLIRSHGVRNTNPTCTSFLTSFKTFTLNNFMSYKSIGSNCEMTLANSGLDNFSDFIKGSKANKCNNNNYVQPLFPTIAHTITPSANILASYAKTYVCGYFAKRLLAITKKCRICYNNLTTNVAAPEHQFILIKQNTQNSLLMPNSNFMLLYNQCTNILSRNLPVYCLQSNLVLQLEKLLLEKVDFTVLYCRKHPHIQHTFITILIIFTLHTWTKEINNVIKKRDNSHIQISGCIDPIKLLAYRWCSKHK